MQRSAAHAPCRAIVASDADASCAQESQSSALRYRVRALRIWSDDRGQLAQHIDPQARWARPRPVARLKRVSLMKEDELDPRWAELAEEAAARYQVDPQRLHRYLSRSNGDLQASLLRATGGRLPVF